VITVVEFSPQRPSLIEVHVAGSPVFEIAVQPPPVIELLGQGIQGPPGIGALAGLGLVRVGSEMRLSIDSLPLAN
jgi:hypothetical protein